MSTIPAISDPKVSIKIGNWQDRKETHKASAKSCNWHHPARNMAVTPSLTQVRVSHKRSRPSPSLVCHGERKRFLEDMAEMGCSERGEEESP